MQRRWVWSGLLVLKGREQAAAREPAAAARSRSKVESERLGARDSSRPQRALSPPARSQLLESRNRNRRRTRHKRVWPPQQSVLIA